MVGGEVVVFCLELVEGGIEGRNWRLEGGAKDKKSKAAQPQEISDCKSAKSAQKRCRRGKVVMG